MVVLICSEFHSLLFLFTYFSWIANLTIRIELPKMHPPTANKQKTECFAINKPELRSTSIIFKRHYITLVNRIQSRPAISLTHISSLCCRSSNRCSNSRQLHQKHKICAFMLVMQKYCNHHIEANSMAKPAEVYGYLSAVCKSAVLRYFDPSSDMDPMRFCRYAKPLKCRALSPLHYQLVVNQLSYRM